METFLGAGASPNDPLTPSQNISKSNDNQDPTPFTPALLDGASQQPDAQYPNQSTPLLHHFLSAHFRSLSHNNPSNNLPLIQHILTVHLHRWSHSFPVNPVP
jgi:hypothetical protein